MYESNKGGSEVKAKNDLPIALIQELLRVDEDGKLFWLKDVAKNVKAGALAGRIGTLGYITVCIRGRGYKGHRLVWALTHDAWPKSMLDHIDGDKANNKPSNLREATAVTNGQNRKPTQGKKSLAGAYLKKNGWWYASIRVDKIAKHLGCFDNQEEAHAAYLMAKQKYHPFHTEKSYAI